MTNNMDIGIHMVHAHVVYPNETKYIGAIPYNHMYTILDALSRDGAYEVFATEDGGKVVGHLTQMGLCEDHGRDVQDGCCN